MQGQKFCVDLNVMAEYLGSYRLGFQVATMEF